MPISQWEGRWTVFRSLTFPKAAYSEPDEDGLTSVDLGDGVTVGWTVMTGNVRSRTPEDYEVEFGPDEEEAARQLAEEFNRYEWQGPLDPAFEGRRSRLIDLDANLHGVCFEGPPMDRWPVRPARYLVRDGGVGWHAEGEDILVDELPAVEAILGEEERSIWSVIDLDTGDEVPFTREIAVAVGVDAA